LPLPWVAEYRVVSRQPRPIDHRHEPGLGRTTGAASSSPTADYGIGFWNAGSWETAGRWAVRGPEQVSVLVELAARVEALVKDAEDFYLSFKYAVIDDVPSRNNTSDGRIIGIADLSALREVAQ
jgi:hypothetical protein